MASDRVGAVAGQLGLQGGAGSAAGVAAGGVNSSVFGVEKRKCFGGGFTEKGGISS